VIRDEQAIALSSLEQRRHGALVGREAIEQTSARIREYVDRYRRGRLIDRVFGALSPSTAELRYVLYELTSLLTAYQTTVFLVGEYTDDDSQRLPEFAVADGILQFMRNPLSTRDERFLRVVKLRGSGYLEGLHAFRIGAGGLEIFPRLVSPAIPENYTIVEERTTTGVPGLDDLMGGGLWQGSTTVMAGPTGAGKTTASLQFVLEGVRRGEPCLYANFQENPMQLTRCLRSLGADVEEVKRRGLHLLYTSPVELQVDRIIVSLFQRIQQTGIRRVVIDAVGDLISAASDGQRLHDYGKGPPGALTTVARYELAKLRREVKRLQMERDIRKQRPPSTSSLRRGWPSPSPRCVACSVSP
jgi:KaiC/GvpD/RAD55 family RecA-like ATPase